MSASFESVHTEPEHVVIQRIVSTSSNENPVKNPPFIEKIHLHHGRKRLVISVKSQTREMETRIDNVSETKEANETTVLYKAAKELMQQRADLDNGTYTYILRTENEKMRDWARGPGALIFSWTTDLELPDEKYPTLYVFEAKITPTRMRQENLS